VTYKYPIRGPVIFNFIVDFEIINLSFDEQCAILLADNPRAAWFELKYCNVNRPQCHSIYYDIYDRGRCWAYIEEGWRLLKFNSLCDNVIKAQKDELETYIRQRSNEINPILIKKIKKFMIPVDDAQQKSDLYEQFRKILTQNQSVILPTYLKTKYDSSTRISSESEDSESDSSSSEAIMPVKKYPKKKFIPK